MSCCFGLVNFEEEHEHFQANYVYLSLGRYFVYI